MKKSKKTVISGLLAASLVAASVCAAGPFTDREGSVSLASAGAAPAQAAIYSMSVHYKTSSKNSRWKEIDTTLVKSGSRDLKKSSSSPADYKTKATELSIKVSRKANRKSVISMKWGKTGLSIALQGKKLKAAQAKVSNSKKKATTDVLNQNRVIYKKVMKNTNISYDIFPEKVQEIISVNKKSKNKPLSFKLNSRLKVKIKEKKVYFRSKKGKTKFTRMSTKITDANGVSTTKVKLSYNKKKKTLKVTPDKKWCPAYEAGASGTVGLQKAGNYQCDVTGIVKAWAASPSGSMPHQCRKPERTVP